MPSRPEHRLGEATLRWSVLLGALVMALAIVMAVPALAAQPNNKACLGEDIRTYAEGGAAFGAFVSGMALAGSGVGAQIQAHLAGDVPDSQIHNSCND